MFWPGLAHAASAGNTRFGLWAIIQSSCGRRRFFSLAASANCLTASDRFNFQAVRGLVGLGGVGGTRTLPITNMLQAICPVVPGRNSSGVDCSRLSRVGWVATAWNHW
jgi:hypothetical protein